MSLTTSTPVNSRLIQDTAYIVSALVPSSPVQAGASNIYTSSLAVTGSTPSLDFVQASPYPTTEQVVVRLDVSAITNTTPSSSCSFKLQDSADNITFADIAELSSTLISATNAGGSSVAGNASVLLPPSVRRYVRAKITVPVAASLATGLTGSYTASVLF